MIKEQIKTDIAFKTLLKQWNNLVDEINSKG
jgi:hypothetical protein